MTMSVDPVELRDTATMHETFDHMLLATRQAFTEQASGVLTEYRHTGRPGDKHSTWRPRRR